VDRAADIQKALPIVLNAKMRRTGVCGATECLLVDKAAPAGTLKLLVKALLDKGCEVRGDADTQAVDPRVKPAAANDYGHEFLDAVIA
ncbi:gamma-glutamyl-phosphate reductase, partial [Acinetobacter baumannii]